MTTVIKSSEYGTFQLMVEHDHGRTIYSVKSAKPYISMFVSNPTGWQEKRSVEVSASSLSTGDFGKLREMAALLAEASDFLSEVNEIVNA